MATVTVPIDNQHFRASLIYDPANTIQGADANTSRVTNAPSLMAFNNMASGTDIDIEGKIHKDDTFTFVATMLGTGGATQKYEFTTRWNYIQCKRTGPQNVVVYAQQ